MSTEPSHSFFRNTEIRQQPVRIVCGQLSQLFYNSDQCRLRKAIEKEVRHQQIISKFWQSIRRNVVMEKANAFCMVEQFPINPLSRQLQHPLARVDAIDLHQIGRASCRERV